MIVDLAALGRRISTIQNGLCYLVKQLAQARGVDRTRLHTVELGGSALNSNSARTDNVKKSQLAGRCHPGRASFVHPHRKNAIEGVFRQGLGMMQNELRRLDQQQYEARFTAGALLGRATPGQQDRIQRELSDLAAERERCQSRLAELQAELETLATRADGGGG